MVKRNNWFWSWVFKFAIWGIILFVFQDQKSVPL